MTLYSVQTNAVVRMQPLFVLVGVFALLILPLSWWTALRIALAAMFLLTASAHWGRWRADLIRMTPAAFSRPDLLVTMTGIGEIAGAIGLLVPGLAAIAAIRLIVLLLGFFPANVRAARENIAIGTPTYAIAGASIDSGGVCDRGDGCRDRRGALMAPGRRRAGGSPAMGQILS